MRNNLNTGAQNHHTQQVAQAARYQVPAWKKWLSSVFFSIFGKSIALSNSPCSSAGKLGLSEVELARICRRLKR